MAEPLPDYQTVNSGSAMDDAPEINVNNAFPMFEVQIVYLTHKANTRVVEHIIKMPVLRGSFLNQFLHIPRLSHIQMYHPGFAAVRIDGRSHLPGSFLVKILGPDQMEKYIRTCPALFDQQRKLYSILDDFQWGEDYRGNFRALAEYFKAHPKQYQISLDYGVRLARLDQLPEDDPEVEALARELPNLSKVYLS